MLTFSPSQIKPLLNELICKKIQKPRTFCLLDVKDTKKVCLKEAEQKRASVWEVKRARCAAIATMQQTGAEQEFQPARPTRLETEQHN